MEALASHLTQTLARLAGELLPHEKEVIIQRIDRRATDDDARLAHQELADVVRPVRPVVLSIRVRTS